MAQTADRPGCINQHSLRVTMQDTLQSLLVKTTSSICEQWDLYWNINPKTALRVTPSLQGTDGHCSLLRPLCTWLESGGRGIRYTGLFLCVLRGCVCLVLQPSWGGRGDLH